MNGRRPIALLVAPFFVGAMVACGSGLGPQYGVGGVAGNGPLFGDTGGTGARSTGGARSGGGSGGRAVGGAVNVGGSGATAVGGRATGGAYTGGRATGGTGVGGSLTNTTWTLQTNCSGCCLGQFTFQAGGTLTSSCSYSGPLVWAQSGSVVTFSVNDGYATYVGTISGNTITGTATNLDSTTWSFSMTLP